jgi:dipeptidyl aminopeptidase/acylaminoacyl peptidase
MPHLPIKAFFKNPEKTQFKISPSGKWIAFLSPYQKRLNIHIAPTESLPTYTDHTKRITKSVFQDILSYAWKSDDTIVYLQDQHGDENHRLFLVNVETEETIPLTPEGCKVQIIDFLHQHPNKLLIGLNQRNPQYFDPYEVDLEEKTIKCLLENPGNITQWLADYNGNIRVGVATDGANHHYLVFDPKLNQLTKVLTLPFSDSIVLQFFSFDNEFVYALSNVGRDKLALIKWDPNTGKEIKCIYEHPEVDLQGAHRSFARKCLTAVSYITWKQEYHFFDKETENLYYFLREHFQNQYEIFIESASDDERHVLFRITSDKNPGSYYYHDRETGVIHFLGALMPWLKEEDLCDMKPITFQSRDGLTLHGYLTLPKEGKPPFPLVVNPHGGPWYRDVWRFNPEVQLLAHYGYAVLQVNFRGSTGYGKSFWMKGFKEWGKKMQDDITDGVYHLINQGIVDPNRIAIYGGSYGGYATLAGLCFTPSLYCCGIDYVGVSNLFTFLDSFPPYWTPFKEMMYEMVGHPEKDRELLKDASPLFHVDQIRAPLLVAQGSNDPRVKKRESDQIVEALRNRGIDVEYLLKEDEGHGFIKEENRIEFYEKMIAFLQKHMR